MKNIKSLCRKAESISANASLEQAAEKLREKSAEILVATEKGFPAGIISAYDVLEKKRESADMKRIKVKDIMKKSILKLDANLSAGEAAEYLLVHKHWLALVIDNKNKKLVGIITARDLV